MGKTIASFGSSFLSTPHGTLGTEPLHKIEFEQYELSTPHGALGTLCCALLPEAVPDFQLHTVH